MGRITGFNARGEPDELRIRREREPHREHEHDGGQTTSRSYTVDGGSNRLDGFSQTAGGTTTNVAYAYNAKGDLTSDGLILLCQYLALIDAEGQQGQRGR